MRRNIRFTESVSYHFITILHYPFTVTLLLFMYLPFLFTCFGHVEWGVHLPISSASRSILCLRALGPD